MMEPPRSESERIVEELGSEPELDEVTRARMEKSLLAAVSAGKHLDALDPEVEGVPDDAAPAEVASAGRWLALGAVAVAAAAVSLVWSLSANEVEAPGEGRETATFQRYEHGQTTDRGEIADGHILETGSAERVQVRVADARVDVTPDSEARFVRLDSARVEVFLARGAVEVELHPERTGDQTLRVVTELAFIDVVGTVFRVSVDDDGDTMVSTVRGTVRVTPRDGSDVQLVRGGEETTIAVPIVAVIAVPNIEGSDAPREDQESEGSTAQDDDVADPTDAPPTEQAPTMSELFARAEARLDSGDHSGGRRILTGIAESRRARAAYRVRAYTLLAESHAAQREYAAAAAAYGNAVDVGGHSIGAQNALFAMGRLFERRMDDTAAAAGAYHQYLELSPGGAHADQIHQALCSMGEAEHCS